jgi:uncharacterized membrane protein YdjX (TVP38/TMEM64 family)
MRSWRGPALAAVILVVLVATSRFPVAAWVAALAASARASGWTGVALFVVAYVSITVAALPASILTMAAGFAYGPVWGLAVASPASVLGATAAFLLGRSVLRSWVVRRLGHARWLRAVEGTVARDGFRLVLLLRLSPLFPFALMNYGLSLSGVGLRTYVAASALGMLPGTAMYVYIGSLAPTAARLMSGRPGSRSAAALYGAGLLATIGAAVFAARAARHAIAGDATLQRSTPHD